MDITLAQLLNTIIELNQKVAELTRELEAARKELAELKDKKD